MTSLTGTCDGLSSWSAWHDRDDPTEKFDHEAFSRFKIENPKEFGNCVPSSVEARVKSTMEKSTTQKVLFGIDFVDEHGLDHTQPTDGKTDSGLVCINAENNPVKASDQTSWNSNTPCLDYEVRFCCQREG